MVINDLLYIAPRSAVRNFTAEVLSPTSVRLNWLPANQDIWNGIIIRYTIPYSLIRRVSVNDQATDMLTTFTAYAPSSHLRNDPNPILVASPLLWEEIEIQGLKAYFIYSFSIYYENSAGQSASSGDVELHLPYSGEVGSECVQYFFLLHALYIGRLVFKFGLTILCVQH